MTADTLARPPPRYNTPRNNATRATHCHNCGAIICEPPPVPEDDELDDSVHCIAGVHASPSEWLILTLLRRHEGRIVTRSSVIQCLYGESREEPDDANKTLDVHLWRLRRKLRGTHWRIETVPGAGLVARRHD